MSWLSDMTGIDLDFNPLDGDGYGVGAFGVNLNKNTNTKNNNYNNTIPDETGNKTQNNYAFAVIILIVVFWILFKKSKLNH